MRDDEVIEIVENLRRWGADGADVEAKRAETQLPKSVRETLSAFSNTVGGIIVLGLDESTGFAAVGVRDAAKMASDLASWCSDDMEPPVRPVITVHRIEEADLVVAEVPELEFGSKPCFYRGAGISQGSYVRVHDGDRRLSTYEVQILLAKRGQPRDDEEPVPGTGLQDLDPTLAASFLGRVRQSRPYAFTGLDDTGVLRRAKVLVGEEPSLAGLLALGRFPQEHFPRLMATFVHYPTVDGADLATGERFIDNVVLEGPIPVIVRDALVVLRRNMSRRAVVKDVGREDTWDYPEPALREVLVNALVHRDLSPASRGTPVQIEMYPDRLLVRNAGGLFGTVTVDVLGEEGLSSARNAVLMQLLEDVPLPGETRAVCENRGSGVRTMISALRRARMSAPEFRDRIGSFTVAFPNHTLLGADVITWIDSLDEHGLTENQCVALAMMRDGGPIDNQTYRRHAGLDSQEARADLRDLVNRGLVRQVGSHRWTRYRLASDPPDRLAGHLVRAAPVRADRRRSILEELASGPLSRRELERRTGLRTSALRRWLVILRQEGLIDITGESARSPDVLYRRR